MIVFLLGRERDKKDAKVIKKCNSLLKENYEEINALLSSNEGKP